MTEAFKNKAKRLSVTAGLTIAGTVLGALGFRGETPADRIGSLDVRVSSLEAQQASLSITVETQNALLYGLARMTCMDDPDRATLAGLPCPSLLSGRN